MKKLTISLALSVFLVSAGYAQSMVLQDPVSARMFTTEKYSGYNGSPFLFNDKWTAGNATIAKGTYKDLELKLDVYNNVLFFKKNEEPWEFRDEVVSFVLKPAADSATWLHFRKGLSEAGLKPQQYVQVLAEGTASLYRSDIRSLSEVNQVNHGVIKTFTNATRYFVKKNGTMQLLKPNKKEILDLLNDKGDKVQAFVTEQKISFKKDADLARLFSYYNTL